MVGPEGNGGTLREADPLWSFLALRTDLVRYVRGIAADRDDVEDIVQETWLRFNAASRAQTVVAPRRFLFRIARNLAMYGHRRRGVERTVFARDDDRAAIVASDEPSVQARIEAREVLAAIRDAIARLPERTRRAFLMHRVERLTLVEIATRLGISKSLAHQLVVDGLERCRAVRRRIVTAD